MVDNRREQDESTWVLIAQLAALVFAFTVPVALLAILFPKHTSSIILVAVYVLFGLSAMFAGAGWNEPNYSHTAKFYTKLILVFTVVAMAASKWIYDPEIEFPEWAAEVVVRGLALVVPFFVGRLISKQMQKYTPKKK